MLSDHYQALAHVTRYELKAKLQNPGWSNQQRVEYIARVIEARAYQIFRVNPEALCNRLQSDEFVDLFALLASEQRLDQIGCFCLEPEAAHLRKGAFPALEHAIADWPVAEIIEQARKELQRARLLGGAITREPIYTGDWRGINLFDSIIDSGCPAARLFPNTLKLLLSTEAMQRSLQIVSKDPKRLPSLIVRVSNIGPQTRIEPHFGVGLWKMRLHLPVHIPPDNCFILAGSEQRTWLPDQALFLDDTYLHAVVNGSNQSRIVLLIDIIHPDATEAQVWAHSK
jgi:hypothetical protein